MNKRSFWVAIIIGVISSVAGILASVVLQLLGGEKLSFISSSLQIITSLFVIASFIYAYFRFFNEKSTDKITNNNVIISVSLTDISADVLKYAKEAKLIAPNLELNNADIDKNFDNFYIKNVDNYFSIESKESAIREDVFSERMREYQKVVIAVKERMKQVKVEGENNGVQVHLFCKGPIVLGYWMGEAMKNNYSVCLYYFQDGKYIFAGTNNFELK